MKNISVVMLVLTVVLFAVPALALGPFYIGANYAMTTIGADDAGLPDEFDVQATTLSAGLHLLDFLSVEARVGFGAGDDTVGSVNAEMDEMYGLYLRGVIPIGMFKPYVIAGYTSADFSYNSSSEDDSDISYGLGLDLMLGDSLALNAEYMRLMEFEDAIGTSADVNVDSLSLGLKWYF